DAADAEQHGKAEILPDAAAHRAERLEFSIRYRDHVPGELERRAAGVHVVLAADGYFSCLADADLQRIQHRLRVIHRVGRGVLQVGGDHRAQQVGGIAVVAAAGIVGDVGHNKRLVVLAFALLGIAHGILDRAVADRGELARLPGVVHEFFGDLLRRGILAIGGDRDARADVADVGGGEAGADADDERAAGALQRLAAIDEFAHRPGLRAAAVE